MLIKFDFGSKTGILVVKFAFGTTNLKIEKLRRRFARVLVWCRLKKLSNQSNRKRFFANRTQNNSTNPTNLKRLIPIEHDLRYKENNTKYRSFSWKPLSYVRISMYRTWLIWWQKIPYYKAILHTHVHAYVYWSSPTGAIQPQCKSSYKWIILLSSY